MKESKDVHLEKAMEIFNKPANQISKKERLIGKKVNYTILYGKPNQVLINIIIGEDSND